MPPQGFQDKGYQSVVWSAHDDNDDDLIFAVYYRGEGEQNWRLLKDKITQRFYSWDTTTMPDGAYYLKIVGSDSPSNPPDQALSNEREADRFEIANTPPRIENLHAQSNSPSATVTFEALELIRRDRTRAVQCGCRRLADRVPHRASLRFAERNLPNSAERPRSRRAHDRGASLGSLRQHDGSENHILSERPLE